jgi:hypothetical protein
VLLRPVSIMIIIGCILPLTVTSPTISVVGIHFFLFLAKTSRLKVNFK